MKNQFFSSLPPAECSSQQDLPLLPSVMRPAPEQVARGTPSANSYMQIAPDMRSSLERKQRYRATRADEVLFINVLTSHINLNFCIVNRLGHSTPNTAIVGMRGPELRIPEVQASLRTSRFSDLSERSFVSS